METGDRCGRAGGRRSQTAHDIVRSGIRQQPPKPANLAAQRADRIADAATEREFCQRCRRRRAGEANDHREVDAAGVKFADPSEDRRAFEAELRHDIDPDTSLTPPIPPRPKRLEGVRGVEKQMALRMTGYARRSNAARLHP